MNVAKATHAAMIKKVNARVSLPENGDEVRAQPTVQVVKKARQHAMEKPSISTAEKIKEMNSRAGEVFALAVAVRRWIAVARTVERMSKVSGLMGPDPKTVIEATSTTDKDKTSHQKLAGNGVEP